MTAVTPQDVREAQRDVLHEYRQRRHMHRPYEAMHHIATEYATTYASMALIGDDPAETWQRDNLARYHVARMYAQQIWERAFGLTHGLAYWRNGTLAPTREAVTA